MANTRTRVQTLIFSTMFLSPPMTAANEFSSWAGHYWYEGSGGHTFGGSPIIADVSLEIRPDGFCHITHSGFQVYEEIDCGMAKSGKQLVISFDENREGDGFTRYKKGQILFVLSTSSSGEDIFTSWKSMHPIGSSPATKEAFILTTDDRLPPK